MRKYIQPKIEIITIDVECALLAGSNEQQPINSGTTVDPNTSLSKSQEIWESWDDEDEIN